MHAFTIATRWMAQKVERAYNSKPPRMFDREQNTDLLEEAHSKLDELGMALEAEMSVVDTCVDLSALLLMIAYNAEMGKGKGPTAGASPSIGPDAPEKAPTAPPPTAAKPYKPHASRGKRRP